MDMFLAVLGIVWIAAAVIQDLKSREVANWINFSLVIFALAYRSFYWIFSGEQMFFLSGILGLAIFFIVAHLFYYLRLFAGGYAKLLIALGAILPTAGGYYENALIMLFFILVLLAGGGVYSFCYSILLSFISWNKFLKEFKVQVRKNAFYLVIAAIVSAVLATFSMFSGDFVSALASVLIILISALYVYVKAVESACLIYEVSPDKLSEGDWLASELIVKGRKINPFWEGISQEEIEFIKKNYKSKVKIKGGVPFTPAFLIAFIAVLYVSYFVGFDFMLERLMRFIA